MIDDNITMDAPRNSVLLPRLPTWRRYFNIFIRNRHLSVFRALSYEIIATLQLTGRVLDFGGGEKSSYVPLLGDRSTFTYESADISPALNPTYLIDADRPLPIPDRTFDHVLAFNVLEHILDVEKTICELNRVLKLGGSLHICVPFLFPVHGAPNDYNRFTAQWWGETLYRHGFNDITVEPLLWDAFSVGLGIHGGRRKRDIPWRLATPLAELIRCKLIDKGDGHRYSAHRSAYVSKFAIGYFINANKTGQCRNLLQTC